MEKFNQAMVSLYVMLTIGWSEFKESERGDTNFVSILIILAIVIVFAGVFLAFGNQIMDVAQSRLTDFLGELGN